MVANRKVDRPPLPGSESFTSLEKTWHLAPIGPAIAEAFAQWCRMYAREMIARDKASMSAEEYRDEKKMLQQQINAGEYEWGPPPQMKGAGMGEGVVSLFNSEKGRKHLFRLLFEPAHGVLTDEEIDSILGDNDEGAADAFNAVFFSRYPWLTPKTRETSQQKAEESEATEKPPTATAS